MNCDGAMRADASEVGRTKESMLLDEVTCFRPVVVSLDNKTELLLDPRTALGRIIIRHDKARNWGETVKETKADSYNE